uniref:Uncharacterized protein n=1 Tax=Ascaris lumbricoides TaxID=6252 RepID=A0A0M3HFF3_ASCLU
MDSHRPSPMCCCERIAVMVCFFLKCIFIAFLILRESTKFY